MGKRFADNDITQDDIEALKKGEEIESKQQAQEGEDNAEQIAERKIMRVKRHHPSGKNEEVQAKGTFKLSGSLNTSSTSNEKPATSLFGGAAPTQTTTSLFGGSKPATSSSGLFGQKPAATGNGSTSLFGNTQTTSLFGNTSAPAKKEEDNSVTLFGKKLEKPAQTLFGGQPIKQQSSEQKTGLFGQPVQAKPVETKSLFGGPVSKENSVFAKDAQFGDSTLFAQAEKKKEEESKPATGGLFGKPAGTTTSLFGGQPAASSGSSLFGQPSSSTGGGLFGSKPQGSLFGGSTTGGSSLFGQPSTGQASAQFNFQSGSSLFGNNNKKEEKEDGDDENDETGNPKNEAPTFKAQPQQESPFEKVFNQYVAKFKIITPKEIKTSLGCGNVTLEKDKKDSTRCFVCFRNTIGKLLYQGQIIKGVSKKRRVTEKANKQQLKIALMRKDPQAKADAPKLQNNFLAINFDKLEQLEQFEKDFDQSLKDIEEGKK